MSTVTGTPRGDPSRTSTSPVGVGELIVGAGLGQEARVLPRISLVLGLVALSLEGKGRREHV